MINNYYFFLGCSALFFGQCIDIQFNLGWGARAGFDGYKEVTHKITSEDVLLSF